MFICIIRFLRFFTLISIDKRRKIQYNIFTKKSIWGRKGFDGDFEV